MFVRTFVRQAVAAVGFVAGVVLLIVGLIAGASGLAITGVIVGGCAVIFGVINVVGGISAASKAFRSGGTSLLTEDSEPK